MKLWEIHPLYEEINEIKELLKCNNKQATMQHTQSDNLKNSERNQRDS